MELFLQGYCALQESQMKFTVVVSPPLAYMFPMMLFLAMPTYCLTIWWTPWARHTPNAAT